MNLPWFHVTEYGEEVLSGDTPIHTIRTDIFTGLLIASEHRADEVGRSATTRSGRARRIVCTTRVLHGGDDPPPAPRGQARASNDEAA
jgi:hypothetical protein